MPLGYLPDTNIFTAYLKRERAIVLHLSEVDFYLSSIVLGELYRWGFETQKPELLNLTRSLVKVLELVGIDEITSERCGRMSADRVAKGTLVSNNDLWIAALASRYDLIIVTRDRDFGRIPGLNIERW